MTTLYAYWDRETNQVATNTIGTSRRDSGEKLIDLVGSKQAHELTVKGDLFITEIKVERVV